MLLTVRDRLTAKVVTTMKLVKQHQVPRYAAALTPRSHNMAKTETKNCQNCKTEFRVEPERFSISTKN